MMAACLLLENPPFRLADKTVLFCFDMGNTNSGELLHLATDFFDNNDSEITITMFLLPYKHC
ncbi:MAG: hypothetical protein PUC31_03285 [Bacteroidales bacterium]|nr:hypothetical protein [Bacteroidales bacterium]